MIIALAFFFQSVLAGRIHVDRMTVGMCNGPSLYIPDIIEQHTPINPDRMVEYLEIPQLELVFNDKESKRSSVANASANDITVGINFPSFMNIVDIEFLRVRQSIDIVVDDEDMAATLEVPWTNCTGNSRSKKLKVDMKDSQMFVYDFSQMAKFLKQVTYKHGIVNMTLAIEADVAARVSKSFTFMNIHYSIGTTICLRRLFFVKDVPLLGMQGLNEGFISGPPVVKQGLYMIKGVQSGIYMDVPYIMQNPSSIKLYTGNVVLDLLYRGVKIGTCTLEKLSIVPGENKILVKTIYSPENRRAEIAGAEVLSRFANGQSTGLEIRGSVESTSIPLLKNVLQDLMIPLTFPGLEERLISMSFAFYRSTSLT